MLQNRQQWGTFIFRYLVHQKQSEATDSSSYLRNIADADALRSPAGIVGSFIKESTEEGGFLIKSKQLPGQKPAKTSGCGLI